jgi:hypothetical protein
MEKRQSKATQKKSSLALHKETLRRLEDSELRGAVGAARLWKPGLDDDTAPIYVEVDAP